LDPPVIGVERLLRQRLGEAEDLHEAEDGLVDGEAMMVAIVFGYREDVGEDFLAREVPALDFAVEGGHAADPVQADLLGRVADLGVWEFGWPHLTPLDDAEAVPQGWVPRLVVYP